MFKYKKILNSVKRAFKIRYGVFILGALIYLSPHFALAYDLYGYGWVASQSDYSQVGGVASGDSNEAYFQELGKLPTFSSLDGFIFTYDVLSPGSATSTIDGMDGDSAINAQIFACTTVDCSSGISHIYQPFRYGTDDTERAYPVGYAPNTAISGGDPIDDPYDDPTVVADFTDNKDMVTGDHFSTVPIDPNLYYGILFEPSDMTHARIAGSISTSTYAGGQCMVAASENSPDYPKVYSDLYCLGDSSMGIGDTFFELLGSHNSDEHGFWQGQNDAGYSGDITGANYALGDSDMFINYIPREDYSLGDDIPINTFTLSLSTGGASATQNVNVQFEETDHDMDIWFADKSDNELGCVGYWRPSSDVSLPAGMNQSNVTFNFSTAVEYGCSSVPGVASDEVIATSSSFTPDSSHYYTLEVLHTSGTPLTIYGSEVEDIPGSEGSLGAGEIYNLYALFNYAGFGASGTSSETEPAPVPIPIPDEPPDNSKTQIISFTPADGYVAPGQTVNFNYLVYVASSSIGFWKGTQMTFSYQHQPIGDLSTLVDKEQATTSGYFEFSATRTLSPGNYIVNACLEDSYFGGVVGGITGIFSDLTNSTSSDCQFHQFTVGTSTYIGQLMQNGINNVTGEVDAVASSTSATIAAVTNFCNPLGGNFDLASCLYSLMIPSSSDVQNDLNTFYSSFLTRSPWGYGTLAIGDLLGYSAVATSSLAASNLTIILPNTGIFATATSTSQLKGKSITFIDWTVMASTTVQNYWAPALAPLNNFLSVMMGAGFIFWLYHFFKKMTP